MAVWQSSRESLKKSRFSGACCGERCCTQNSLLRARLSLDEERLEAERSHLSELTGMKAARWRGARLRRCSLHSAAAVLGWG